MTRARWSAARSSSMAIRWGESRSRGGGAKRSSAGRSLRGCGPSSSGSSVARRVGGLCGWAVVRGGGVGGGGVSGEGGAVAWSAGHHSPQTPHPNLHPTPPHQTPEKQGGKQRRRVLV